MATTLRFSNERTATTATQVALERIAAHLGVSQNKAAHMAINFLYDELFPGEVNEDYPTPKAVHPQIKSGTVVDSLSKLFPEHEREVADLAINQGRIMTHEKY
ncbi:hypothetical protein [Acidithiobacillus ferriphilus]|uniref:hypothetical protein n=1 Tax=Acidithiobacillus ferriphilus TaxID=1689834 RepID=UPI002DB7419A|nr:hypothetical protein [Acidithiobacillus ferriphilus]MEB8476715.1 hypothetical protein [Acidithiobacillus ferriphilus]